MRRGARWSSAARTWQARSWAGLERACEAGLLVVVDMHQDLFGEGFASGDGAPRWTCEEERYAAFAPKTPWFLGYLDPNPEALDARDDVVVGFDVLNDP